MFLNMKSKKTGSSLFLLSFLFFSCNENNPDAGLAKASSLSSKGLDSTVLSNLNDSMIPDSDARRNGFQLLSSIGIDYVTNDETGLIKKSAAKDILISSLVEAETGFALTEGECQSSREAVKQETESSVEMALDDAKDDVSKEDLLLARDKAIELSAKDLFKFFGGEESGLDAKEVASFLGTKAPIDICSKDPEFKNKILKKSQAYLDYLKVDSLDLEKFSELVKKLRRAEDAKISKEKGFLSKEESGKKLQSFVEEYKDFFKDFLSGKSFTSKEDSVLGSGSTDSMAMEYVSTDSMAMDSMAMDSMPMNSNNFTSLLEQWDEDKDGVLNASELAYSFPFSAKEDLDLCGDTKFCEVVQNSLDVLEITSVSSEGDLKSFKKEFRASKRDYERCFHLNKKEGTETLLGKIQKEFGIASECSKTMAEEDELPKEMLEKIKKQALKFESERLSLCQERQSKFTGSIKEVFSKLGLDPDSKDSVGVESCVELIKGIESSQQTPKDGERFAHLDKNSSSSIEGKEVVSFLKGLFGGMQRQRIKANLSGLAVFSSPMKSDSEYNKSEKIKKDKAKLKSNGISKENLVEDESVSSSPMKSDSEYNKSEKIKKDKVTFDESKNHVTQDKKIHMELLEDAIEKALSEDLGDGRNYLKEILEVYGDGKSLSYKEARYLEEKVMIFRMSMDKK